MDLIIFFKKISIFFTLMFAQLINNIDVHDYYVSTTEVNFSYNNHLQITVKVFIDDFEEMIQDNNNNLKLAPDSDSKKIDQITNQYISEKLIIKINNSQLKYEFIGREYKSDILQLYYEAVLTEKVQVITFENNILYDYFKNQQNIVHFKNDKFRRSFLFTKNNSKSSLSIN